MKFLYDQLPNYDLTYNDVFMVPQKTDVASRFDVDLTTPDNIGTSIPLIVANMTAVAGKRMAETVARRGGLVVLPQDIPLDKLTETINYVKSRHLVYETPITLLPTNTVSKALSLINKRAHGAVIVVDENEKAVGIFKAADADSFDAFTPLSAVMSKSLITIPEGTSPEDAYNLLEKAHRKMAPVVSKSGKVLGVVTLKGALRTSLYKPNLGRDGNLNVAVAIGINGDVVERVRQVVDLGVDLIVLDTAHGHQQKMIDAVKTVRAKFKDIPIVAGNVVTADATRELIQAGANIVKVGVGPGAMCTTRMMTGVGRPQFSAVMECAREAKKLGGHVWADGGIRHPRDVALALAAGASNVMFASWLAGTYEAAADVLKDTDGRLYKESFGMASQRAVRNRNQKQIALDRARKELFEEGISSSKMYLDPRRPGVEDLIDHIIAGVRSACTYAGARNITELQEKAVLGVQSTSGYAEGMPVPKSWS